MLNKSHEYGVAPWHWYFTSALPRALLIATLLVPFGLRIDRRTRVDTALGLLFVAVYSILPHKVPKAAGCCLSSHDCCCLCCVAAVARRSENWSNAGLQGLKGFAALRQEMRFVFYVVPLLNIPAAVAIGRGFKSRNKNRFSALPSSTPSIAFSYAAVYARRCCFQLL